MSGLPKRVLVTGGGTGIGLAVVNRLIELGAEVVAVGRRLEVLESAKALGASICSHDVRSEAVPFFETIGPVDGLVLNAGVQRRESIKDWSENAWREVFETNLFGAARLIQAFVAQLDGPGSLVGIASTLAVRPAPQTGAYAASKAGLIALLQNVALEGAGSGLRANIVLPGIVETSMIASDDAELMRSFNKLHPLGRIGQPPEVAQVVVDVLRNPWMTGAQIPVDGGLLLGAAEV